MFLNSAAANTTIVQIVLAPEQQAEMNRQADSWLNLFHRRFPSQNSQQIKTGLFPFSHPLVEPKFRMQIAKWEGVTHYSVGMKNRLSMCWLRNREYWVWKPIRNCPELTEFSCSGKAGVQLATTRHVHFQLNWIDFPYPLIRDHHMADHPLPDIPKYQTPYILHVQGLKRVGPRAPPMSVSYCIDTSNFILRIYLSAW